ncbi:G protein-coupled seven transmembrane receptor [Plasmopara halstedii]|uniref:G protein-coupled seven transmembrane receptor n=1 Tax=Plasmopara halstedii TaxID=4781 RepID=A0A0P1B2N4_PLAHL|nr:G protein-coupled seven transmembrane receptor [Plasmopara halstedii]CEG48982.1 G protein-coupled seven transmembrane receptor [Plasmopara halstedii]|eukprot:XP_024585351.1 G protein-coupled seven transmembrane receptor [Plasmopara halstedii]
MEMSQHYDPLNFVKGATVLQHTPRMYIRTYENAWLSLLMTLKALIITTSPECRYRLHSHRTKIIITKKIARLVSFNSSTLLQVVVALIGLSDTSAMKQTWVFESEIRSNFLIERFGFGPQGQMNVSVSAVKIKRPNNDDVHAGLLFVHEDEVWETIAILDDNFDSEDLQYYPTDDKGSQCMLVMQRENQWINLLDSGTWNVSRSVNSSLDKQQDEVQERSLRMGFYYIFYVQCTPGLQVSFNMNAQLLNGESNFLSAGDAYLPFVYLTTSFLFLGATIGWIKCLVKHRAFVLRMHWLMALLVTVKTLLLFAEAMRVYYMKCHGDTLTAWTPVVYTFMSLKGLLLFSIVMLIGTGWTLLKPHLSQKDKSILSLVLGLQILSNIAQIFEYETPIGTRAWMSWRDLLVFADLACSLAVLMPLIWSIRQLRVSAATDGNAFATLQKLTQFRSFYSAVICYIYISRLIYQLLDMSLPYDATWVAVAFTELAALCFFTITGYRFRPLPTNPYLEVPVHEDDLDEFALDDEEDNLDFHPTSRTELRQFAYGAPVRTKANDTDQHTNPSDYTTSVKKRSGSGQSDRND